MAVVQALCTTSTKMLYWQYNGFVPMIQKICTIENNIETNRRIYANNEHIEDMSNDLFSPEEMLSPFDSM